LTKLKKLTVNYRVSIKHRLRMKARGNLIGVCVSDEKTLISAIRTLSITLSFVAKIRY